MAFARYVFNKKMAVSPLPLVVLMSFVIGIILLSKQPSKHGRLLNPEEVSDKGRLQKT